MIFRCYVCEKLKLKTKKVYTVELQTNGETFKKKHICKKCGDQISKIYDDGKILALEEDDD